MSKYVELANTGVIIDITKHGRHAASLIAPEDLKSMEDLIEYLGERAERAIAKQEAEEAEANAKKRAERKRELTAFKAESKEIGELMIRAVQELFDGKPELLREMAAKYLES